MADLEKRAWFEATVALTATALWLLLFYTLRVPQAAMAAFALLACTAWPWPYRDRPLLDEHDRAVAEWAQSLALRCLFALAIVTPVLAGWLWGWERAIPVWALAQGAWIAWILLTTIRAGAMIARYRSERHA
jgi:hypothetical protein